MSGPRIPRTIRGRLLAMNVSALTVSFLLFVALLLWSLAILRLPRG